MSDYIRLGTQFPKYYQFPEFLLRAPISQTAKLAYMVLYDRARLSLKNEWVADGKIYTVFPIAELAETLGKSQSTVKSVLNELDEAGLLILQVRRLLESQYSLCSYSFYRAVF